MWPSRERDFDPPYHVQEPTAQAAPVVVSSPHSGRVYPPRFLAMTRLDPHALRRSEDAFVDLLLADAPSRGATLIHAAFPRAYLDVNREPYELDPAMFEGRLPGFANTRSPRVAGGLGSLPKLVADGQEIYARKLPVSEAMERIERLHRPFHAALRGLLDRTRARHGAAALLDMHSMPSGGAPREGGRQIDVVLGDRFGASCARWLVEAVEARLRAAGLVVSRNRPYAGGYITEICGDPARGAHALQIEVSRALYMDERRIVPNAGFAATAALLSGVVESAAAAVSAFAASARSGPPPAIAAE